MAEEALEFSYTVIIIMPAPWVLMKQQLGELLTYFVQLGKLQRNHTQVIELI